MILTLLQTDIVWDDAEANIAVADRLVTANPGADLYVLPEMWATGFVTAPTARTLAAAAPALDWMRRTAAERRCAVAGSLAVDEGGSLRNRLYFVTPDEVCHYDKHHLFTYGGEHLHYAPGADRVVVSWAGARILLQVCYDLRFPVFARNHGDYDVALYVANWPESRQLVWETLTRARALENQCFVAAVNRAGRDPLCPYVGGTLCVDAYGHTLADAGRADREAVLTVELDLARLARFRTKFPVLSDADAFRLEA